MRNLLSKFIRLFGFLITVSLAVVWVLNKFIINKPARLGIGVGGSILAIIIFMVSIRVFKMWHRNKLVATEVARELQVNGRTSPFIATLVKAIYVLLPGLILTLLLWGVANYDGVLWIDCIKLIGTLAIYFIFDFVALSVERYFNKKRELQKLEKEQDMLVEKLKNFIK